MRQRRPGERQPVGDDAPRQQREPVAGGDQREQPARRRRRRRRSAAPEAVGAGDRGQLVERRADRRARRSSARRRGPRARPCGRAAGDRPAPRPRAPPPTTSATVSPSSGSRSGSLTAATPSTKPTSSTPVATSRAIVDAVGHAHGDRQRGRDERGRVPAGQRRRPDPQRPRRAGRDLRHVGAGRVEAQQDRLGVLEQPRAGLGRLDRPARQQRRAEVGLQHRRCAGRPPTACSRARARRPRTSRGGRRSRTCEGSAGPSAIADQTATEDRWT